MTSGGCPACHAQPLTTMVIEAARTRWPSLSADVESAQVPFLLNAFTPQMLQLAEGGGMPDALVYATMAMATQQTPSSRATDALVRYLAAKQRTAGNWKGVGGTRAPMQDGDFSRTAMAIRALTVYGTPALTREYQEHVGRAAGWLSKQTPLTTEDRVMQLLGLSLGKCTLPSAPDARPGVARASAWGWRVVADAVSRHRCVCHGAGSVRASGTRRSSSRRRAAERRRLFDPDAS